MVEIENRMVIDSEWDDEPNEEDEEQEAQWWDAECDRRRDAELWN